MTTETTFISPNERHTAWVVRDDDAETVTYYLDTFHKDAASFAEVRRDEEGVLRCYSEADDSDATYANLDEAENALTRWAASDISVIEEG